MNVPNRLFLNRAESIWVEATETHVVVSWAGGHHSLPYEPDGVNVPEMLRWIRAAIEDTYEPHPMIRYRPKRLVSELSESRLSEGPAESPSDSPTAKSSEAGPKPEPSGVSRTSGS